MPPFFLTTITDNGTFKLWGISYRKENGLLQCYSCEQMHESADFMRRHVEREHAPNQTVSIRTNIDPDEFTPAAGNPPLPEATSTTVTPDETVLDKKTTMDDDSCGSSTGPLMLQVFECSPTPALGPGFELAPAPALSPDDSFSERPPRISNSKLNMSNRGPIDKPPFEDHVETTTAPASSTDDYPIQPLTAPLLSSSFTRRTRQQTARTNSALKDVTASVVNGPSGSESGHASPTPTRKNTCPITGCGESFNHTQAFHRRLRHTTTITIGVGPHRLEVKRGEGDKFTCPLCSTWANINPEKLRVSGFPPSPL